MVPVDETMTPLAPALAWFDPRRVALFDELAAMLPPPHRIGAAQPNQIGQDQSAERRVPAKMAGHRGVVPNQIDGKPGCGHEQQIGS